jgi:hypothetical protein
MGLWSRNVEMEWFNSVNYYISENFNMAAHAGSSDRGGKLGVHRTANSVVTELTRGNGVSIR